MKCLILFNVTVFYLLLLGRRMVTVDFSTITKTKTLQVLGVRKRSSDPGRMVRGCGNFETESHLNAWLFFIVQNMVVPLLKKKHTEY